MGLDYSGRIEHWYALSLRILTTTDPKPNLSAQKLIFLLTTPINQGPYYTIPTILLSKEKTFFPGLQA